MYRLMVVHCCLSLPGGIHRFIFSISNLSQIRIPSLIDFSFANVARFL
jgi:hypothetical protein